MADDFQIKFLQHGSSQFNMTTGADGLSELEKVLKQLPNKIADRLMRGAIGSTGKLFVDLAKAKIMSNGSYSSGRLHRSIAHRTLFKKADLQLIDRVGPKYGKGEDTAPHAHLVEFGHRTKNGGTVAPKSFLRSTGIEQRETITKHFVSELQARLKKLLDK